MAPTRYIVLIDAGSTGSRLSIFRSPYIGAEPPWARLGINQIFEGAKSQHEIGTCGGGIHCAITGQDVKAHLGPILDAAVNHLRPLGGADASTPDNTVIYLLATAGMRNLGREHVARYDYVLHHAGEFIRSYSLYFRFHTTNIRTIPGQQEGLFVWTYLNYGRPDDQGNTTAVLEMGGASHQFAYAVQDNLDPHALSVCTNIPAIRSQNRKENVYARSWDEFGVDAYNNLFVKQLVGYENPCLPTGQKVKAKNGVEHTGKADFKLCREIATNVYEGFEFPALPNSPNITSFEALSNYWHTYEFFSQRHGAGYIASNPYNAAAFNAAVLGYCNESWDNVKEWVGTLPYASDEYTQRHCLLAATLLHILKDAPKPVSMRKSEPWTWGAAALIANNRGLKLCHDDEQELPLFLAPQPWHAGKNGSLAEIPPTFPPHAFVQPALIIRTPSIPLWAYLSFAAALMLIGRLVVQRYHAKALGKICLPDMESASGAKGDMKDLAGTVQGLEGFYKD